MKKINKNSLLILIALFLIIFAVVFLFSETSAHAAVLDVPVTPETYDSTGDPDISKNPIIAWIQFAINLLTVVIVAGSAVMMAFAGVQYISSRDNSNAVQEAKKKITNVITGLIAYFFLYGFVQWLIPGGVF